MHITLTVHCYGFRTARFVSNTFLAEQVGAEALTQACNTALEFLLKHNFIVVVAPGRRGPEGTERDADGYGVAPTQLGQARRVP